MGIELTKNFVQLGFGKKRWSSEMVKEKRWGLVTCCGGVNTSEVTRMN
jgi:hypothetical protein